MPNATEQVRADLNGEADMVMNESLPTPTQEELNKLKTGEMEPIDIAPQNPPAMPPLPEQQARLQEAEAEDQKALAEARQQKAAEQPTQQPPNQPPAYNEPL